MNKGIFYSKTRLGEVPYIKTVRLIFVSLVILILSFISCSKRNSTQFSENLANDNENPISQDEFIRLMGPEKYAEYVAAIGSDHLNRLSYGIGQSNTIELINLIGDPNKLNQMLTGANALSGGDVADLLITIDEQIDVTGSPYSDTVLKIANLINNINDMQWVKDLVKGVVTNNLGTPTAPIARLGSLIAQVDEGQSTMPNLLNDVASTAGGLDKIIRIINETNNITKLSTIVNDMQTESAFGNLISILIDIDNDGKKPGDAGNIMEGTDALIATLNNTGDVTKLTEIVNELSAAPSATSNDDDFEVASIESTNMKYAAGKRYSAGGAGWALVTDQKFAGAKSLGSQPINHNEVASVVMRARLTISGTVSFYSLTSAASGDCLRFYVDDILKSNVCGSSGWSLRNIPSVSAGTHEFRWEYVKDSNGIAGSDKVWIDNVSLPGERGANRTPSQKVAIMLNKIFITSINNISEILNGLNPAGLDALIGIINRTQYPLDINETPNLITIVNQLDAGGAGVGTLVELMNGLNITGFNAIAEIIDNANDGSLIVNMVNGLFAGATGQKVYEILNGLDAQGTVNLVKVFDAMGTFYPGAYTPGTPGATGLRNSKLLEDLLNGATSTALLSTAMNELDLNGQKVSGLESSSTPTGARKLANVILQVNNRYAGGTGIWVSNHMVRLLNEMNILDPVNGAKNVARIVSDLDQSISPNGVNRMADVLVDVKSYGTCNPATGTNCYRNATWDSVNPASNDHFGKLTTLIADMGGNGAKNIAKLVNTVNSDRLDELVSLVKNSNRIKYVSRLVSESGDVQVVADIVNAPNLNVSKVQDLLNDMGNNTNNFGDPSGSQKYTNQWLWPTVANDVDKLGRLIAVINGVNGGVANVVKVISDVTPAKIGILQDLIKEMHRVGYLTRLMNEATNIDLVIALINNSPDKVRLMDLVNTMGDLTYGGTIGTIGSYAGAIYGTNPSGTGCAAMSGFPSGAGCDSNTTDRLGKTITMINEITSVPNTVALITSTDATGFQMVKDFVLQSTKIRYATHVVNGVSNISLFVGLLNGLAPAGRIDFNQMIRIINNVGGSTRKGVNTKSIGDMSILYDTINELGFNPVTMLPRSDADQARVITIVNNVLYCGIRPQFDRDLTPGSPVSEYYPCDTTVSYNYNKATDTYDRRHRVSNFFLGMSSARASAIIVGNVTNTQKTVDILNGFRRINTLIKAVDWMPGEVTSDLVNYTDAARINTGFNFLANNLDPDEDIAAQAFTSMIHWGVGIPDGTGRNGSCTYFTAIGPKRLGGVLNVEYGLYIESILTMFGWRTAIPALVCGFGALDGWSHSRSPSAVTSGVSADGTNCTGSSPNRCQNIPGQIKTVRFKRTESVAITNNPTPGPRNGTNYTHVYQAHSKANCERYYPENSGALGFNKNTDQIVSDGFAPIWGVSVNAGIGGVWDVLKGAGIVGWLLQNNGTLGTPPLVGASGSCTGSGGNEWDCIKQGKDDANGADNCSGNAQCDMDNNVSYYRWGNYCSIPGYGSAGACEGAGGRWMPNKNYGLCQINPAVNAPIE